MSSKQMGKAEKEILAVVNRLVSDGFDAGVIADAALAVGAGLASDVVGGKRTAGILYLLAMTIFASAERDEQPRH
ncbi:MAG: hypothetical protein HYX37_14805 [Rhizobiales bacterium]|nr:hypothetical protein [Hyphomicrobiales bacterium]